MPSSLLRFGLQSGLLLSDFHTKTFCTFSSSPMRSTFPARLLRLDLNCIVISADEYKLCTKSHKHLPVLSLCQTIHPVPRLCIMFRNKHWVLWWGGLLAHRTIAKLEDHPLSAVCDCLFNIFVATLYIWRLSPLSPTRGRAMLWWQWTHFTCKGAVTPKNIVLTSTPKYSKWSLSSRLPTEVSVCISFLSHACCTPSQSHSRFLHPNNNLDGESVKPRDISVCSFPHPPTRSFLFPLLMWQTTFHILQKTSRLSLLLTLSVFVCFCW
jgi:hypothetical protein